MTPVVTVTLLSVSVSAALVAALQRRAHRRREEPPASATTGDRAAGPAAGGVALLGALAVSVAVEGVGARWVADSRLLYLLGFIVLAGAIGLIVDRLGLPRALRAIAYLAPVPPMAILGVHLTWVRFPRTLRPWVLGSIGGPLFCSAIGALTVGGQIGLDALGGLVASNSATTHGALALAYFASGCDETGIVALALCGGCFGMVLFEYPPGRPALGTGGAAFVGVSAAGLVLRAVEQSALSLPAALLLSIVPLFDGLFTVLWRCVRWRRPWIADDEHLPQLLVVAGATERGAVITTLIFTLALAGLGLELDGWPSRWQYISYTAIPIALLVVGLLVRFAARRRGRLSARP